MDNTTIVSTTSSNEERPIGEKIASTMWLVFPPVYVVIGTIANILAILVLTRRKFLELTSTIFLIALAVWDLIVLYTSLMFSWTAKLTKSKLETIIFCNGLYWFEAAARDCSVWILVVITVDRIAACSIPVRYRAICTKSRAIAVVVCVTVSALFINFHMLFGFEIKEFTVSNKTISVCIFSSEEYMMFYTDVAILFNFFKFSLIPSVVIAVGSVIIMRYIYKSAIDKRRQVGPQQQAAHAAASSMRKLLIVLNAVFLVCTTPIGIFRMVTTLHHPQALIQAMKGPVWAVVCMLLYLNNVLNFFCYILTGIRFRDEFKIMVKGWFSKRAQVANVNPSATNRRTNPDTQV